jgi:hypothetical protein
MQMGCLMGWIGWVELVVVRGRSKALEWKRKEFWNEGGRSCGNWLGFGFSHVFTGVGRNVRYM